MEREGVEKTVGCGVDERNSRDGVLGRGGGNLKKEGVTRSRIRKSKAPGAKVAPGAFGLFWYNL